MTTRRLSLPLAGLAVLLFVSAVFAGRRDSQVDRNLIVHLSAAQAVPPVESHAQGEATFRLSRDGNSLSYKIITANIDDVTLAHIHVGARGTSGPVVVNLYPIGLPVAGRASGVLAEGSITSADLVGPGAGYPLSALVDAMAAGLTYVDVHTLQYPEGEIRGQLGSRSGTTDPGEPPCTGDPLFTVLPVSASVIHHVSAIGTFFPPGHTVPSDHGGISPTMIGVPLVAPGDLHLKDISRVTYLVSPFRQGTSDYTIDYAVCGTIYGHISHMPTVADSLAALLTGGTCTVYSTADEQVETCGFPVDVHASTGSSLGTASTVVGGGFDFGLYDDSHENYFVNPSRVHGGMLHAVCAFDYFEPTLKEFLLSQVSDGTLFRTDEPRCGTMEVDVAGTAQGIWVMESNPVQVGGDESFFLTLALDVMRPLTDQVLSVGSALLGPRFMKVTTRHVGRVNRAFTELSPDLIYCYSPFPPFGSFNYSYFVSLGSDGALSIEKVDHVAGVSPCFSVAAPSWTFSTNRIRYIR